MSVVGRLSVITVLAAAYYSAMSWIEPRLPFLRFAPDWHYFFPGRIGVMLWFELMHFSAAIAAALPISVLLALRLPQPNRAALSISALASAVYSVGLIDYLGEVPHAAPVGLRLLSALLGALAILCAAPLLTGATVRLRSDAASQLRVVAIWYALLSMLCSASAFALLHALSLFRQGEANLAALQAAHPDTFYSVLMMPNPATPLLIVICVALASMVASVLSLRYLALRVAGQFAALVVSLLLALGNIFEVGRVTFLYTLEPGMLVWWGLAGACSFGCVVLWRHRRISNIRWTEQ